jgi:hypothetical protein
MPEQKSPHLWIWITIILLVVIVLVVIFVIQDQKKFDESVPVMDISNAVAPVYEYSAEDQARIEQEARESNEAFMRAISGEQSSSTQNSDSETTDDIEYREQAQQHNQAFIQLFQ